MVDSTPDWQGPSSRIIAILSPRSASTCVAIVGLMRPDKLADGAAIGRSASDNRALTFSGAGTRSAIVSRPAVTKREIEDGARNGTTTVMGPGQKLLRQLQRRIRENHQLIARPLMLAHEQ